MKTKAQCAKADGVQLNQYQERSGVINGYIKNEEKLKQYKEKLKQFIHQKIRRIKLAKRRKW